MQIAGGGEEKWEWMLPWLRKISWKENTLSLGLSVGSGWKVEGKGKSCKKKYYFKERTDMVFEAKFSSS